MKNSKSLLHLSASQQYLGYAAIDELSPVNDFVSFHHYIVGSRVNDIVPATCKLAAIAHRILENNMHTGWTRLRNNVIADTNKKFLSTEHASHQMYLEISYDDVEKIFVIAISDDFKTIARTYNVPLEKYASVHTILVYEDSKFSLNYDKISATV